MLPVGQSEAALPIVNGSWSSQLCFFVVAVEAAHSTRWVDIAPQDINDGVTSLLSRVSSKDDSTNLWQVDLQYELDRICKDGNHR